jgi:hypothetical protein
MPPVSLSFGLGLSVIAVPVGVGVPPPVGEIVGLDVGEDEPVGEDDELGLLDEVGLPDDVGCDLAQRDEASFWLFAPLCSVVSASSLAMSSLMPADSVGVEPTGGI